MAEFSGKTNTIVLCYSFLFLVDLVAVFKDYAPVSALKVIVYLCSFGLFVNITKHSKTKDLKSTKSFWSLTYIYFTILFIRLFVDFVIPWKGFFLYLSPLTIIFFYFVTMIMPSLYIRKINEELDYIRFSLLSGIFLCLYLFFSYKEIASGMLLAATTGGQFEGLGGIDIISYGHLGLSLIILAVYIIMYSSKKLLPLGMLFIAVGLSAMVLSGSRSPFVALAICLFVLLKSKYSKWYYLLIGLILVVIFANLFQEEVLRFNDYLKSMGISSFDRVVNTFWGEGMSMADSSSGRDDIWAVGWSMFIQNPILGVSYLMPDDSYVHNIFIEQFMSLGLLGGILFILINIKTLYFGWKTIVCIPQTALAYVLFIQYLVLGCFSRTIIALGAYWLFMFITIKNYERVRQNENSISSNTNL